MEGQGQSRTQMSMKSDFAVVGCGVLGTSLCRQLLNSPEFGARVGVFYCLSYSFVCDMHNGSRNDSHDLPIHEFMTL